MTKSSDLAFLREKLAEYKLRHTRLMENYSRLRGSWSHPVGMFYGEEILAVANMIAWLKRTISTMEAQ